MSMVPTLLLALIGWTGGPERLRVAHAPAGAAVSMASPAARSVGSPRTSLARRSWHRHAPGCWLVDGLPECEAEGFDEPWLVELDAVGGLAGIGGSPGWRPVRACWSASPAPTRRPDSRIPLRC